MKKTSMKMAMKLTTGILAVTVMAGGFAVGKAAAQNTDAIDNARSVAKSLQQKQANDTNAALDAAGVTTTPAKPAPGAPAPAVKPAAIPGANQASTPAAPTVSASAKPAAKTAPAAKPASAHNQLQKVNVVKGADTIQVEISSSEAVTPRVTKLASPARILIEFPETVVASAQNKIAVGAGGVKGVRIGMDGKTPPTTSVVVDLEKALTYELTPGAAGQAILTLHTEGGAETVAQAPVKKNAAPVAVQVKSGAPAVQAKAVAGKPAVAANLVPAVATKTPAPTAVASKGPASKDAAPKVAEAKDPFLKTKVAAEPSKSEAKTTATAKAAAPAAKTTAVSASPEAAKPAKAEEKKAEEKKPEDKKWAMSGKRDPFFSPVVQQSGSGCSTGKKCLEINAINLRGVVKSDNGFIAVVTNNLNKAYFLRENDPVFNGYVVKITGDSVVFQETVQDKLGKTFTREVVKRIFTPAV
jgi:Tfp pilus assembly protein PilP